MKPEAGVEHVVSGDNKFKKRMRFHQSWLRRQHDPLLTAGPHPMKKEAHRLLGNMLTYQDGELGYNFLFPWIATYAKRRQLEVRQHIRRDRLLRNMLGSQTMCFNLFTPLALDLDLAFRLLSVLPNAPDMKRVKKVVIEFAPRPALLNDKTSHDTFVEYEGQNGKIGFIAIETKLTEPFTRGKYDFHAGYGQWQSPRWWWLEGKEVFFSELRWNQLWRNHLLSYAMLKQAGSVYSQCHNAVVYHKLDTACARSLEGYQDLLTPVGAETLLDWGLDTLVRAWEGAVDAQAEHEWIAKFRQRYLDLDASESEWNEFQNQ